MKTHSIQTTNISVKELHIRAIASPSVEKGEDGGTFKFMTQHSEYDPDKKTISVIARVEVGLDDDGKPKDDALFELKIEIRADFKVDDSRFPLKHISHWASHNAPMILFPYLREQAYSLTQRCGFKGMLLPLLEIPLMPASAEE